MRRRRLDGVEESGVELARLQFTDERRLGEHVRRGRRERRQRGEVVTRAHAGQGVDREHALGVGRRIGSPEQESAAVNDVVPGLGLKVPRELRIRVVAEHQGRTAELVVGRDPASVSRALERRVDSWRGTDEDVTHLGAPLDLARERR